MHRSNRCRDRCTGGQPEAFEDRANRLGCVDRSENSVSRVRPSPKSLHDLGRLRSTGEDWRELTKLENAARAEPI